ncbi:unnamed protein product [Prorocentrum cordatum]|uniref:Fe2OG dioxygenase domain-containing protein n=1 Tax=Prorocentrum cordatum TaxID=2364126 RepID=A0ABN9V503_9DINO|nr:unnamed protein product [Polarella glacialis]
MCRARCRRRCSGRGPTTRWTCRTSEVAEATGVDRFLRLRRMSRLIRSFVRTFRQLVPTSAAGHRARGADRAAGTLRGAAAALLRAALQRQGPSAWRCPRRAPCGATSGWVARTSTGCSTRTSGVDKADGQKVQKQSRKDKKESLDTNGVPWSIPSGGSVARMFGQPSVLPEEDELPGFRAALEEYAAEMFRLSKKLLSIMARVLGHPADFFDQYLTAPVATHRLLHYWPLEDFQTEIGVGEHTDYGLLTVLAQDTVGGLQVLNAKDGRWVHCVPIPNAFVVNLGDMLARWTNHKFKSTIHRVVTISRKERYSVPFFLEPNMDAQIALGGILPAGEAPAAPGDTAEDILERFYRASGQLKPRGAAGAPAPPRESEAGAGAAHGQPSFEPPPRVSSQ